MNRQRDLASILCEKKLIEEAGRGYPDARQASGKTYPSGW